MRLLCPIAFAMAASCGQVVESPFEAGQRSGTRLKLAYYDFSGVRTIAEVYDAAREEVCEVRAWSDGNQYCTPTSVESVVYADAACTTRVGLISNDPCLAPKYLVEYDHSSCDTPIHHLYGRGNEVSITQYWYRSAEGCTGPFPTSQRLAFAVGTEVAATRLVRVTIGPYEGTDRLQQRFLTSSDGLRLLSTSHYDSHLEIPCNLVSRAGDTQARCIPVRDAPISYFQDPGCSGAVAATQMQCPPPALVAKADSCGGVSKYFRLGSPIAASALYVGTPQTCRTSATSAGLRYFSVGQEVELAALRRIPKAEGSRLHAIQLSAHGEEFSDGALYDRDQKTECKPVKLSDGKAYCLPFGATLSTYYTDANCSAPVDVVAVHRNPGCAPTPIPPYALKASHNPSCGNTHVSRPVTKPHVGLLYEFGFGHCVKHPVAENTVEYDVGSPLPLRNVPVGTYAIDSGTGT
jgi:hypothetical protein